MTDVPALREPKSRREGPRKGSPWPGYVKFMHEHEGESVFVGEFSAGIAPAIRRGEYPAFFPEGFEGDRREYMEQHYTVQYVTTPGEVGRGEVFVTWNG